MTHAFTPRSEGNPNQCTQCGRHRNHPARMNDPLPPVRVVHPHVEVRTDLLDGSPCIRGTRVPVRRLWSWFSRSISAETLIKRYPSLGPAKVLDALAFAFDNPELVEADLARERAMMGPSWTPGSPVQLPLPEGRPPR